MNDYFLRKRENLQLAQNRMNLLFHQVSRLGSLFCLSGGYSCSLKDVVYDVYIKNHVYIEALVIDNVPHFVGGKEHAKALCGAYGGQLIHANTSYRSATPEYDAWIWNAPRDSGLYLWNLDEVYDVLF